jgi:hypothetical protein
VYEPFIDSQTEINISPFAATLRASIKSQRAVFSVHSQHHEFALQTEIGHILSDSGRR